MQARLVVIEAIFSRQYSTQISYVIVNLILVVGTSELPFFSKAFE